MKNQIQIGTAIFCLTFLSLHLTPVIAKEAQKVSVHSEREFHYQEIIEDIEIGSSLLLKRALMRGANPNHEDSFGLSLLMYAVYANNDKAVELLIIHGAEVGLQDRYGRSALHGAAIKNNNEILNKLLEAGAAPNVKDRMNSTAIHHLASKGNLSGLKTILKYGGNLKQAPNELGETPFFLALWHGEEIVQFFLENGSDVNQEFHYKMKNINSKIYTSPLNIAASIGDPRFIDYLVDQGAKLKLKSSEGELGALDAAIYSGSLEAFTHLKTYLRQDLPQKELDRMLFNTCRRYDGQSILGSSEYLESLQNRCHLLAKELIFMGADINKSFSYIDFENNDEGKASLLSRFATKLMMFPNSIGPLLEMGAGPNLKVGRVPLIQLAIKARVSKENLEKLIQYGADVNARDENGKTALHAFGETSNYFGGNSSDVEVLKLLLDSGADLSAKDDSKRSFAMQVHSWLKHIHLRERAKAILKWVPRGPGEMIERTGYYESKNIFAPLRCRSALREAKKQIPKFLENKYSNPRRSIYVDVDVESIKVIDQFETVNDKGEKVCKVKLEIKGSFPR